MAHSQNSTARLPRTYFNYHGTFNIEFWEVEIFRLFPFYNLLFLQLFNLYCSLMRNFQMNESVPVTNVLIDVIASIGFSSFHLIDFYSVANISSVVEKMVREELENNWSRKVDRFKFHFRTSNLRLSFMSTGRKSRKYGWWKVWAVVMVCYIVSTLHLKRVAKGIRG